MSRTTVVLPEDLRFRARERARRDGITFAELVRQAIVARLGSPGEGIEEDPVFGDVLVYEGAVPPSLSEEHDVDLYGETT